MSSQEFLWLNIGVGLVLFAAFWIGRRGVVQPSRLNLRKNDGEAKPNPKISTQSGKSVVPRKADVRFESIDPNDDMRSLNIMFMFNGHSWDAHEALGLPPGSSWASVEAAFKQAAAKASDQQSLEFLKAAVEAIRRTL